MTRRFEMDDFLPYLLNQAAETSGLSFQTYYKDRYGMLRTEWRVLNHLGRFGEMTAKAIGARAKIHKTKVSRAVAALERRRFLIRRPDTRDRRIEWLGLTEPGAAAYADLSVAAEDYDATLRAQFTEADAETLLRCLRKLAKLQTGERHGSSRK